MGTYREESIKKLDGFTRPTITRNEKGKVLSVGMVDGQRYYQYDKTKSKLSSSLPFDESMHRSWGGFSYYLNDMAMLIDNGQIYIEYVKPVEVEKEEIPDNQISMFG